MGYHTTYTYRLLRYVSVAKIPTGGRTASGSPPLLPPPMPRESPEKKDNVIRRQCRLSVVGGRGLSTENSAAATISDARAHPFPTNRNRAGRIAAVGWYCPPRSRGRSHTPLAIAAVQFNYRIIILVRARAFVLSPRARYIIIIIIHR